MRLIAFQIFSLMSWLQHRVYTIIIQDLSVIWTILGQEFGKTSFKFSAPKIWETVPSGLKCLPYHKFKKEWKCCLQTNQIWPCLYLPSLILFEILFLSLLLPIISTWQCPTRKLLLLWTPYTIELIRAIYTRKNKTRLT